jgi:hypothetical protein
VLHGEKPERTRKHFKKTNLNIIEKRMNVNRRFGSVPGATDELTSFLYFVSFITSSEGSCNGVT